MDKPKVIVVRESVLESIVKDVVTISLFGGMIGVGVIVGSPAMQWAGAIVAFATTAGMAIRTVSGTNQFTIDQARAQLDKWEGRE